MNWFRQNKFLGTFLIVFGVLTLGALYFLWSASSSMSDAKAQFDQNATELNRLQHLNPFPNDDNLKKMAEQAKNYASELNKLKEDLKTRVLPVPADLKPNEFQSHLRQSIVSLGEKARANKVKLPENFFLGFEEFSSTLPDTAAAPGLGQQLAQAELLASIIIDARVDALISFHRVTATAAVVSASPTPAAAPIRPAPVANKTAAPLIERTVFDFTCRATPSTTRRVLNQIASINQQFCVVRTMHVLNDKETGPLREGANAAAAAATPAPGGAGLNFIVGNEHIQAAARVEMLRFNF